MSAIVEVIASELIVQPSQIQAAIDLLDGGATVPFIARYRKEATQNLDDTQLRFLQERLLYLRELNERRDTVLKCIEEQGKLTEELKTQILSAQTKIRLEDLYRPYKPKRRTKGQMAIEAGLEPLAEALLADPSLKPEDVAQSYLNAEKGIDTLKAALEGARYILMERFAENADCLEKCRKFCIENAFLQSQVIGGKEQEGQKFKDYFAHQEKWQAIPSHRMLAMLRGRKEGFLQLSLILSEEHLAIPLNLIAQHFNLKTTHTAASAWFQEVLQWTWRVKIHAHLETELIGILREKSEEEAIDVFKHNLHDLLMAAPAGALTTMGLDPGLRTGVKIAVVSQTGKLLATDTIYPHVPQNQWQRALAVIHQLVTTHEVQLISIGNGTASRETEKLVDDYSKLFPQQKIIKVITSEAGASVYSASELAAKEFPDLDVSLRGAVSIARRVQDPLAELVKIEPKSIGVGQYQHDVNQSKLARTLDAVVEDAVNAVGVDLNTASAPLLARISGLNQQIAQNIITFREQHGPFKQRVDLKQVARLGDKAFEQAAGFLKIINGNNPLDASQVHPEAYPVVEQILIKTGKEMKELIAHPALIQSLNPKDFVSDKFGLPTIQDILKELEKPGRDPRASFKTAQFKEGIEQMSDLKEGMILEGVVTNVANFGAFVDIGVHQDGLVHISALSNQFIKDPRTVVKAGQIVTVKVLEVDVPRKRISLTMRLEDKPSPSKDLSSPSNTKVQKSHRTAKESLPLGSLAQALQDALKSR